jgi:hypothetical protein
MSEKKMLYIKYQPIPRSSRIFQISNDVPGNFFLLLCTVFWRPKCDNNIKATKADTKKCNAMQQEEKSTETE